MSAVQLLKDKREETQRPAEERGATNVRVFGSVVGGEGAENSDADFLVQFDRGRALLDQVALLQDLEDLLGRKVDVATEDALHCYVRDRISEEASPL